MKFLLLLAVLVAVYWIFKAHRRKIQRGSRQAPRGVEDMVRCAQCGLHLPRSESLMSGQVFYCSAEHRRLREPTD